MAQTAIHLGSGEGGNLTRKRGLMVSLQSNVQEKSVPLTSSPFIDMVVCGPSVKHVANPEVDGRTSVAFHCRAADIYYAVRKVNQISYRPTSDIIVSKAAPLAFILHSCSYMEQQNNSEEPLNQLHELGTYIAYA